MAVTLNNTPMLASGDFFEAQKIRIKLTQMSTTHHFPLRLAIMTKVITPLFEAKLVTFDTTLPVDDVVARLDVECNKKGSIDVLPALAQATSKEDVVAAVNNFTGGGNFLYAIPNFIFSVNPNSIH